jgi:N-acetylglucosaminyldiphosphoundecaprenol N-acetyl-beta-D-mannosaminyltransferase
MITSADTRRSGSRTVLNSEDIEIWIPAFQRNLHWILGIPFDATSLENAVDAVRQAAASGERLFISTPNLNFLINSQRDPVFASSVVHSDLSLPDGMPIVWLARLFGMPIRERVAGSSLFEALNQTSTSDEQKPLRIFFFGGPEGAGQAASEAINSGGGAMECAGFFSPGFGSVADMSTQATIDRINQSAADFLVVALGASKGQAWIEHNLPRLKPPVISHLGAVINFVGGSIKRAPAWVQKLGLEWAWRVKEEPSLWKRYWSDGLSFLNLIATQAIPLAILVWRMKAKGVLNQPCQCSTEALGNTLVVRWLGPLTHVKAGPLYEHFTYALRRKLEVELDLSQCTFVDTDVIPHLAAVDMSQKLSLRRFYISGASPSVTSIFSLANAPFSIGAVSRSS